jgi:hypothetical protein
VAAQLGHLEMVGSLLARGANTSAANQVGVGPIAPGEVVVLVGCWRRGTPITSPDSTAVTGSCDFAAGPAQLQSISCGCG